MSAAKPVTIDAYISAFPEEAQKAMEQIRALVQAIAPAAEESISYAMPAFKVNGRYLVYFAAFKNHIGFYPAPVENEAFSKELKNYKTGKGSVQFPLKKPMPLELIDRLIRFQLQENLQRTKKNHSYVRQKNTLRNGADADPETGS